ncbi:MAG: HAMP domain-containing sensor histidine kinase, partial [Vicingaceae bacterium]
VKAQHAKEDFTKELEVKVKVRTKELEESLEREKEMGLLKTSFVSMASHQFRTPLAVIQSNTELLEIYTSKSEKKELEKYKKVTDRIILAISNMTELMDEVLILGKLTSRNIHYRPKYIDLVELLEGLIIQFNSIQKDDRLLDFEIKGIPYQIFLDSKLLSHALENLISNAFKYSVKRKNPKLQLVFKPQELSIIVQDYGLGIPSEEIENLFQPFFRAENVTEIRGTGLGLSIAKEYSEINKGEIEAKSTLREGSCFEIKFKY